MVLVALAGPVRGDPPKVPADPVKVAVGEDQTVEVVVPDGKAGAFGLGFDPADCTFFRGYSEDKARMVFLVRPKRPGRFVAVFWTVGEAGSSRLVIDAAGPQPPPPQPGPGPGDPLLEALQGAFRSDGKPADAARALAGVYRLAAKDGGTADDPGLTTLGGLLAELHAAGQQVAPDPALAAVRAVIRGELTALLGAKPDASLDAAARAACKTQFGRLATLLETLK